MEIRVSIKVSRATGNLSSNGGVPITQQTRANLLQLIFIWIGQVVMTASYTV